MRGRGLGAGGPALWKLALLVPAPGRIPLVFWAAPFVGSRV